MFCGNANQTTTKIGHFGKNKMILKTLHLQDRLQRAIFCSLLLKEDDFGTNNLVTHTDTRIVLHCNFHIIYSHMDIVFPSPTIWTNMIKRERERERVWNRIRTSTSISSWLWVVGNVIWPCNLIMVPVLMQSCGYI